MIYYSIQLVLYWIHCRQDLSSSLWPAIEWDSAGRPRCQHLDYWSDWWIDDVSASPFFSPATTTKNRKSVFEIWFFYAPFFFCFCFVCHAWRCEVSHRIFTVSRFVLFEINITSDWNGDCDGEGCSLGLAGIDGDGLGVRKGPGGDNIPRMQKKRREKKTIIFSGMIENQFCLGNIHNPFKSAFRTHRINCRARGDDTKNFLVHVCTNFANDLLATHHRLHSLAFAPNHNNNNKPQSQQQK